MRAVNSGKAVAAALDFKEPHVISVLAQLLVSRGYGRRVSDAEVRNNPGLKDELCRDSGSDIRVSSACASSKGQDGEADTKRDERLVLARDPCARDRLAVARNGYAPVKCVAGGVQAVGVSTAIVTLLRRAELDDNRDL